MLKYADDKILEFKSHANLKFPHVMWDDVIYITFIELFIQIECVIFVLECRCHFDIPFVAAVVRDYERRCDCVADFSQNEANAFSTTTKHI